MGRRPEETFLYKGHTDCRQAYEKMFKIASHLRNANQNYNEISPNTGQNGYHQKKKIHKQQILEMVWREGNPPAVVGGNVNWQSHCGEQCEAP